MLRVKQDWGKDVTTTKFILWYTAYIIINKQMKNPYPHNPCHLSAVGELPDDVSLGLSQIHIQYCLHELRIAFKCNLKMCYKKSNTPL